MEIASVPAIVALTYFFVNLYKSHVAKDKETLLKIIPIIAAVLGVIIGIIALYAAPEYMPTDNILTAMLIGGASGLASTGANQVVKQLGKPDDTTAPDKKDGE
ncbi:MAG: phage holin family protein [Clostridiales bacterium]|jgi:fucose permease|nr:phage holin family protein [Clostridiales bacterium]